MYLYMYICKKKTIYIYVESESWGTVWRIREQEKGGLTSLLLFCHWQDAHQFRTLVQWTTGVILLRSSFLYPESVTGLPFVPCFSHSVGVNPSRCYLYIKASDSTFAVVCKKFAFPTIFISWLLLRAVFSHTFYKMLRSFWLCFPGRGSSCFSEKHALHLMLCLAPVLNLRNLSLLYCCTLCGKKRHFPSFLNNLSHFFFLILKKN